MCSLRSTSEQKSRNSEVITWPSLKLRSSFPLKNLKETLKFLTDQGFQETAQIQEEDTYFNSVYHDVKKRDEALRIRTSTDCRSGISKTQINFKGPKLDKISMSRMELETEVSDAEVT